MLWIITPEKKYHVKIIEGPCHPTSEARFLLNKNTSRTGLVMFKYKFARLCPHFSVSEVRRWSGFAILESKLQIL